MDPCLEGFLAFKSGLSLERLEREKVRGGAAPARTYSHRSPKVASTKVFVLSKGKGMVSKAQVPNKVLIAPITPNNLPFFPGMGGKRFHAQALRSLYPVGARWLCGGFSVQASDSLQCREQLHSLQDFSK